MVSPLLSSLLTQGWFVLAAMWLLTLPYWSSGLFKLADISGALDEVRQFGLKPAWMVLAAMIVVQLGGSLMIVMGWAAWIGASMLAVFTAWAARRAHPFWTCADRTSMTRQRAIFLENLGLIGGLMLAATLSEVTR